MRTAIVDGVFTKRAETEDEAERLRQEVQVLQRLRHPGVVDLREFHLDTDTPWLRTAAVEGAPLESLRGDGPGVSGLAAAVATTVADLHDLGFAHGAIEAGHVLLDQVGRPVLCGLGRSAAGSFDDDVQALARLVLNLLPDPLAATRTEKRLPRESFTPLRRACEAAIDPATAKPPSARQLADAAWEAAWAPVATRASRSRRHRRPARFAPRILGPIAAIAVAGLGVALVSGAAARPPRPKLAASRASNVFEFDGVRYAVGAPGDTVITGRFDCDHETAAVHTKAGGLFVFDHWAGDGEDLSARHVTDVPAGASVRAADDDHDGCDDLVVEQPGHAAQVISPRVQP